MTEIPEHLLKRSRERRAAMGGGDDAPGAGDTGDAAASTSAAPAKAAASAPAAMPAHPAPAEPPSTPPPSPMVEAYRKRRKIPFWAMPVLVALPVWAYVYAGTLDPPPAGEGPVVLGEEAYAGNGCGGCHGATGGGGVGPAFTGGAIYETFPTFEQHFQWVRLGSTGWQEEVGDTYGANEQPVSGGMPGFGEDTVSDADMLYIVMHERTGLGGENPSEDDAARLEMASEIFFENPDMTLDEVLEEVDAELPPGETSGGAIEGQGESQLDRDAEDLAEDDPELG